MSFTGSNIGTGLSLLAGERSGAGALTVGRPRAVRNDHRQPQVEHVPSVEGLAAVRKTADWLLDRQAADGHWRGPLEGDTILESEYVIILAWADRLGSATAASCARRILREQLPTGGWSIYPGGPVDVSASVKAYLALKLTGHDQASEPLVRARGAIRKAGGPWAVNSFTRFYLALLGQIPYSACPAVPPEMVLLPSWFPVNLHRVSAWSRTMIVPLSLMWASKPVRQIVPECGMHELFEPGEVDRVPACGGTGAWDRFFRLVDRVMKGCEAVGFQPLRSRAMQACRRWMLARFEGSDGLGAIFPPIVWSIVALRSMGCDEGSPEVMECWRQLEMLVEPEPDGSLRIEPCRSPVWDTAITLRALADATAAGAVGSDRRRHLDRAVDWLLDNELRGAGDWRQGMAAGGRPPEASGWCFQYANRFYPDVDDTAMVIIALVEWRRSAAARAEIDHEAAARLRRVAAALGRAVGWLRAMQNSDGGWAAFDRDNDLELLCRVPFADHNAMIDPSTPDITGRVLEALGRLGFGIGDRSVDQGVAYLRESQRSDGSWFGRWGVNYIYGTWQSIEGLRAVGMPVDDPSICRAATWLLSCQQSGGGWGESPDSYADPALAGCGPPTPSQTAWALAGLVAAGRHGSEAVEDGMRWLVGRQGFDGSWEEGEFTGTGFPKVFYLRYHYYCIYFPLMAMARWCHGCQGVARGESRSREMVA